MIGTEPDGAVADRSSTSQLEYRLRSSSSTKAGLISGRPGKELGVKLKSLDGGEVPNSSKLADEAGEAVTE